MYARFTQTQSEKFLVYYQVQFNVPLFKVLKRLSDT